MSTKFIERIAAQAVSEVVRFGIDPVKAHIQLVMDQTLVYVL